MISLKGVSKRYPVRGGWVTALTPMDLEVADGELVWISGASGAGKSTLLGICGLLVIPDEGEVWIDGSNIDLSDGRQQIVARQSRLGFVPQQPRLFAELTALQNVRIGQSSQHRRAATDALLRVGMDGQANLLAGRLSGGQQQRVSIARAIVDRPTVLVADEPSSGLDDDNAARIFSLLRDIAKAGTSVCVASHDSRLRPYADREIALSSTTEAIR